MYFHNKLHTDVLIVIKKITLKISVKYVDDEPVSLKYKSQNSSILLEKIKGTKKSKWNKCIQRIL